jgi:small subunit ribosomal protein S21
MEPLLDNSTSPKNFESPVIIVRPWAQPGPRHDCLICGCSTIIPGREFDSSDAASPAELPAKACRLSTLVPLQETCVVKLRLRENESVQEAVRRFRKLVEHAGVKKEMRRREFYEKPSEQRRRERRRAERRARFNQMQQM